MALVFILVGILVALLIHWGVGLACILIGLLLLIWPEIERRQ